MKNKENKNQKNKTKRWTAHRIINTFCVLFISGALIVSAALFFMIHDIMSQESENKFNVSDLVSKESSGFYDANDEIISESAKDNENRELVDFESVPQTVVDAFLSIEDSRFYTHNGFDLPRFVSSMIHNVKGLATGNTSIQGGSTLTMQMIDQFYTKKSEDNEKEANDGKLSKYKEIQFKIQEVFKAIDAESKMEKDEILMKYLNQINFGAGAHGIQKAAEYYFGKNVSELNLSESAFLAGVINAPSAYNPYSNYDLAVQRRNSTLAMMLNHGYITKEQQELALNTELAFQLNGEKAFDTEPFVQYTDVAKQEASKLLGGRDVVGEGMKVYTYMDRSTQQLADQISSGTLIEFPGNSGASPDYQFAFTIVDNSNGAIIGLSNGRRYDEDAQNKQTRAVNSKEPGSSMKPLLSYAPAFDILGWSTVHTVDDKKEDFYGNGKYVNNFDQQFRGPILLQEAIDRSLNTTALSTYIELEKKVGNEGMQEILRNLQFNDTVVSSAKRSFALGSGDGMEISTAEMAAAYASFANEGQSNKAHTVRKIVDSTGTVLYDAEAAENSTAKNPYSPQAAYMISTMLNKAMSSSENMMGIAGFPTGYKIYGKTGTVGYEDSGYNVPANAAIGNWMVNYTKEYSVASWVGFDKKGDLNYMPIGYGTYELFTANLPAQINKAVLNHTVATFGNPGEVSDPGGVSTITIKKGTFPYQSGAGLPDEMTATGMIKSQFSSLSEPTLPKLDTLSSFSVTADQTVNTLFTVAFKEYVVNEDDKEVDGSIASLNKKVVYVVDVSVNGHDKSYESENPTFNIDLAEFAGDKTVNVVFNGYYKVQDMDIKSNVIVLEKVIEFKEPEKPNPEKPDPEKPDPEKPNPENPDGGQNQGGEKPNP